MAEKILIAEDDVTQCWLLEAHLLQLGYSVQTARDGREIVRLARTTPCRLIFMDLNMPIMDGYEATKLIRSFEAANGTCSAQIIAMGEQNELDKSLTFGMSGYLRKPIDKGELQIILNNVDCRILIQKQMDLRSTPAAGSEPKAPVQPQALSSSLLRQRNKRTS
ncbi:MAG: response regulator [Cyanobacteria bacterium SZAS-4]|nr:response regulator [Cyanobacteria bacterium SZAS-4]